jgi:peptidoglycan hydrolase CwlO-like protein
MYQMLDEKLVKEIEKITMTEYEKYGIAVKCEGIEAMLSDLVSEIHHLEERYEELEEDLRENYKHITVSEQVGISDRDFI